MADKVGKYGKHRITYTNIGPSHRYKVQNNAYQIEGTRRCAVVGGILQPEFIDWTCKTLAMNILMQINVVATASFENFKFMLLPL